MKEIKVKIQDADRPVTSYQCAKCGYFDFEEKSINEAINEIKTKESTLAIKQKIIKLSHDRLGMYINRDIAITATIPILVSLFNFMFIYLSY